METKKSLDELVRGSIEVLNRWIEDRIGREFKVKYSLYYPHGKMVRGKIKSIKKSIFGSSVIWEATFTDGFMADYATGIEGFILTYGEQL